MGIQLRRPTERTCELCDRREKWDENVDGWQIAREDGEKQVGEPHCIHEWDITGSFNPIDG